MVNTGKYKKKKRTCRCLVEWCVCQSHLIWCLSHRFRIVLGFELNCFRTDTLWSLTGVPRLVKSFEWTRLKSNLLFCYANVMTERNACMVPSFTHLPHTCLQTIIFRTRRKIHTSVDVLIISHAPRVSREIDTLSLFTHHIRAQTAALDITTSSKSVIRNDDGTGTIIDFIFLKPNAFMLW